MSKYTPGTWTATARRVTAPETDGRLALDVQINGGNRDDNKANARLIAAAPNLLAALTDLLYYSDDVSCPKLYSNAVDLARSAIAKATGVTP